MIISFFLLTCLINICYGTEYIYPIGSVPQSCESKILFMHQHADRHMQVFLWDSIAQTYEVELSSQYNPIGVQLLPNGTGFSFIDNGIVKVKLFSRRSAKIIEIYEPLYNIANITWISETDFLFQAQRGNRYGIYRSDLEGTISSIQADTCHDYGYPALADTILFFISKDETNTYCIVQNNSDADTQSCIYTSQYPLMYLTMLSAQNGYVLEKREGGLIICYFKKEKGQWQFEDIFHLKENKGSFFDNNASLCEILRPFLPKFEGARLFMPSFGKDFLGGLIYYDTMKHCANRLNFSSFFLPPTLKDDVSFSFFGAPLMIEGQLFIGLAINN